MNKAGTQRIETQRLILRRFRIDDAEDMFFLTMRMAYISTG